MNKQKLLEMIATYAKLCYWQYPAWHDEQKIKLWLQVKVKRKGFPTNASLLEFKEWVVERSYGSPPSYKNIFSEGELIRDVEITPSELAEQSLRFLKRFKRYLR